MRIKDIMFNKVERDLFDEADTILNQKLSKDDQKTIHTIVYISSRKGVMGGMLCTLFLEVAMYLLYLSITLVLK